MRLDDLPESSNIEDRRGETGGGGFGGFPGGSGGLGIGTIVVLGLIGWALGIDPRVLIGGAEMLQGGGEQSQVQTSDRSRQTGTPQDDMGRFVARILGSTEVEWKDIFAKDGQTYRAPRLVMYNGSTDAGCGEAQSAMGPFYCPTDQKVYLDTSFFREIQSRFHGCDGKSCQFAQAYVIAHEVGHHVQNLLGILPKVERQQQAAGSKAAANQLQVKVELQADCLAGVWANHSEQQWNLLEPGDVDAALSTAAAIGDDTLQKKAQGYAVPDSFTHGTSAQRQRWFNSGFKGGTIASCNTFGAQQL
jgi:predicted metalloprotease